MSPNFVTPRNLLILISAVCFGSLVFAWVMEHVFGVLPCVLCLYQRYIYIAVTLVAGMGAFVLAPKMQPFAYLGCLLGFLSIAGISFFQVGVEMGYFELPAVCKASIPQAATLEALKEQLMQKQVVPCDQVNWRLFGFSMASYSLVFALVLAGISLGGLAASLRKKEE